jgi:hypothetical protein
LNCGGWEFKVPIHCELETRAPWTLCTPVHLISTVKEYFNAPVQISIALLKYVVQLLTGDGWKKILESMCFIFHSLRREIGRGTGQSLSDLVER